jgi:FkbM family methyltransferase
MGTLRSLVEHIPQSFLEPVVRVRRDNALVRRCTDWFADRLRSRDTVIRAGIGAGLRFNSGRSNSSYFAGAAEPDVQRALIAVLKPAMTFYDIGAHLGFYTVIAASIVTVEGRVLSFEPLPDNQSLLKHNIAINRFSNIRHLPIALGAEDGEARFLVSSDLSQGTLAASQRRLELCSGEIAVNARRLDSLISEDQIPPPDVVKMDIEGGEIAALSGATHMLTTSRPVLVIELHDTASPVANLLVRHGYETCLLGSAHPVEQSSGNTHMVAVPSERGDCRQLLQEFRDLEFPRCERCRATDTDIR